MKYISIIILAVVFAGASLAVVGCFDFKSSPASGRGDKQSEQSVSEAGDGSGGVAKVLRDIGSAPAASIVSDRLGPFFWAGLGFIVLGGAAIFLGARATGLSMFGLGVGIVAVGVFFSLYPWMVLVAFVLAAVVTMAKVVDSWRQGRALAIITENVENTPGGEEVKAGIKSMGHAAMRAVRSVVDPIKAKLEKTDKGKAGQGTATKQ